MKSVDNTSLNGFSFIDLFAGIGGFHLALSSFGAKCLFASEWDKYAAETYSLNFGMQPLGDITQIHENQIPHHDILCAGFPCQAFSVSGKQRGFEDTRGTLFFEIARIVKYHKPKILFLENVKNLVRHDEGRTFQLILSTLQELNYSVFHKVLKAADFGLPQNRERIYIVAFRKDLGINNFEFPYPSLEEVCLADVLEDNPPNAKIIEREDIELKLELLGQNTFFGKPKVLNKPLQIGKVNKGGQGERIYHPSGHAITLSAHGGGVGAKTGLYLIDGKIRKLTPRECARVQGFPDDFLIHPNSSQAYKQFGNSVAINVLQEVLLCCVNKLGVSQSERNFA